MAVMGCGPGWGLASLHASEEPCGGRREDDGGGELGGGGALDGRWFARAAVTNSLGGERTDAEWGGRPWPKACGVCGAFPPSMAARGDWRRLSTPERRRFISSALVSGRGSAGRFQSGGGGRAAPAACGGRTRGPRRGPRGRRPPPPPAGAGVGRRRPAIALARWIQAGRDLLVGGGVDRGPEARKATRTGGARVCELLPVFISRLASTEEFCSAAGHVDCVPGSFSWWFATSGLRPLEARGALALRTRDCARFSRRTNAADRVRDRGGRESRGSRQGHGRACLTPPAGPSTNGKGDDSRAPPRSEETRRGPPSGRSERLRALR